MHFAIAAARRWLSSRMAGWIVAGVAAVVALVAIVVGFVLPGSPAPGTPTASSFNGLPQVGALFEGAWRSSSHFCSGAVVDSPSGDVIVTAAHCLSGDGQDLEFVPMYHDGQAPYGAWDVTGAYVSQRWTGRSGSAGGLRLPDRQPARQRRGQAHGAKCRGRRAAGHGEPAAGVDRGDRVSRGHGRPADLLPQPDRRPAGVPVLQVRRASSTGPAGDPGWPTTTPGPVRASCTA